MSDDLVRVVALEKDMEYLKKEVASMAEDVRVMRATFEQAKGARWAVVTLVGVSSIVGGLIAKYAPLIAHLPKP